jgi:hypothetical protein
MYDTGISGIDLKFDVNREQALVMIEINSRKEERRLEYSKPSKNINGF